MDQDLAQLSSSVAPKNVIAATNSYDVEYLKHYTGISETFFNPPLMKDNLTLNILNMKLNLIIILDPVLLDALSGFYTSSKFQYRPTRPEVLLLGHIDMDSFCPSIDRTRHVELLVLCTQQSLMAQRVVSEHI